jgi:uncharacterized Fe-S radical SAM superfamily protein PflX
MKQFVPEYKSMHSDYEEIDRELENIENKEPSSGYYFNPTAPISN